MTSINQNEKKRHLFLCLFLLIFVLASCSNENHSRNQSEAGHHETINKNNEPSPAAEKELKTPISIDNGEIQEVCGWLDNETILYMTSTGLGSNIYTYDIYKGESSLFFASKAPAAAVIVSPSGKYILVQSAPSTYEGILTILNTDGKEVMTERIPAVEFNIVWNPYDETRLFISAFSEDWEFTSYEMNIGKKILAQLPIKEPFAYWTGENEMVYLSWENRDLALFAPLMKFEVSTQREEKVMDDIFYFKAVKDVVMAISIPEEPGDTALYSFFANSLGKISEWSVPVLTEFSGWLVPYFDFDDHGRFYSFQPLYSGEADTYMDRFQLISFEPANGERKIINDQLENEPISCSPNGKLCLYGFYFEKIINMETNQILPLTEEITEKG